MHFVFACFFESFLFSILLSLLHNSLRITSLCVECGDSALLYPRCDCRSLSVSVQREHVHIPFTGCSRPPLVVLPMLPLPAYACLPASNCCNISSLPSFSFFASLIMFSSVPSSFTSSLLLLFCSSVSLLRFASSSAFTRSFQSQRGSET